jgi:cytochrome d ubiquinol oxidase subunit II
VVVGAVAVGGLAVLAVDAPALFDDLTGRALPLVVVSVAAGVASLGLIAARRYRLTRVTAALAVAAVLWAWGAAQYPVPLRPDLTVDAAAGDPTVLSAVLGALAVGGLRRTRRAAGARRGSRRGRRGHGDR